MNANQVKEIKELLSKPKNVVIVTHWSPDGDAMGSSLGLYNYLTQKKHKVTVITPNDYPSFLYWLPGNKNVINFSTKAKEAKVAVAKANIIFCLDFNSLKRIDALGDEVGKSKAKKCIIDHHLQPEDFADFMLHDIKACSTCELIHDFIELMGDKKLINKNISNCLYTGIMTDTGSFRFPSTTSKTHRIIAELIEAGAENSEIHNRIYDDNTEDKLRLLGFCLAEKLTVLKEYGTAFFSLRADELKHFNYRKGDTEGVVNYALSIEGIRFAAFFVERDGIIKTSFRSKGDFNVNLFSRKHFSGGGHANAAGGMSEMSLDETIIKFVSLLAGYKKELHPSAPPASKKKTSAKAPKKKV
ncbi:MAG: bifunctional oligoribonuclease/PAP phosphatase NrnA [Bacteroidota bacterium]